MRNNHEADTVLLEPEWDMGHKKGAQQQLAADETKGGSKHLGAPTERTLRDLNTSLSF